MFLINGENRLRKLFKVVINFKVSLSSRFTLCSTGNLGKYYDREEIDYSVMVLFLAHENIININAFNVKNFAIYSSLLKLMNLLFLHLKFFLTLSSYLRSIGLSYQFIIYLVKCIDPNILNN